MRLVAVKILCLYLLASCKPLARQEEPTSKEESMVVLRTVLRAIVTPIIGSKTAVQTMAKGIAKQKSYKSLSSQLQDIWWEVVEVRKGYVGGVEREVGGWVYYPKLTAAHKVDALKKQAHAKYRGWAEQVAQSVQESLDTNQLFQPSKPGLKTGLTREFPNYYPETMNDLVTDVKKLLNLLESPLEF